jgi:hypothetical protein
VRRFKGLCNRAGIIYKDLDTFLNIPGMRARQRCD